MFERSDLKTRAKLALTRNYWGCVIAPVLLAAGTWLTSVILNLFTGPSVNYDYAAMPINAVSSSVTVTHVSPMYWVVWLALMFLVLQPLLVGVQNFFIKNARYKGALRDIMPKSNYAQVVIGTLVQSLLIVLFTCLLIVPGIVTNSERTGETLAGFLSDFGDLLLPLDFPVTGSTVVGDQVLLVFSDALETDFCRIFTASMLTKGE